MTMTTMTAGAIAIGRRDGTTWTKSGGRFLTGMSETAAGQLFTGATMTMGRAAIA